MLADVGTSRFNIKDASKLHCYLTTQLDKISMFRFVKQSFH